MKLSTKGRYAMVALADLALAKGDDLVSLAAISKRQDISLPYLEPAPDGGRPQSKTAKLSDFKGKQVVVLAFFPAAFSPG